MSVNEFRKYLLDDNHLLSGLTDKNVIDFIIAKTVLKSKNAKSLQG